MSAPSSNPEEEGDSGPPEVGAPTAEEDLDSDVGTIFSDEEEGKKLSEDEDEEEGELVSDDESGSSLSSDSEDGSEKCPICLQRITDQEIGSPEMCEHQFCLRCITAWSKKMATCPIDRKFFSTIIVKKQLNGDVVRIEEVKFSNAQNNDEQYDSDPTFCEVCGRCDREDRLLLCDGCDLGYHLECLDPPLDFIPIEDWYCPNCVLQGLNQDEEEPAPAPVLAPPSPSRSLPSRIPRTRQNERILQSIDTIDPVELDTIVASVAAGVGLQFPAHVRRPPLRATRTRTRRSGTRKYRKRKSVTAATSGSGGRRKRRSRRKTRKRRRVAVDKKPNTARGRIAHHLGIMPPLPGQVYVGLPPACRSAGSSSSTSTSGTSNAINTLRYSAGITPLRMFGAPNDLSDLVDSWSDDEGPLASAARFAPVHQSFGASLKGPAEVVAGPSSSASGSCDVLGLILKKQYIFLNDKNVKITRDGTLVPSLSSTNLPDVATSLTCKSSKNTSTVTSPSLDTPSSSPSRYSSGSLTVAVCGLDSTPSSQTSNANASQQTSGSSQDVRCGGESDSGSFIIESSGGANQSNSAGNQNISFAEQTDFNLSEYWGTQQPSNQKLDEDDFDIYSDIEEQPQDTEKTDSSFAKTSTTTTSGFPLASPVADTSSRRTSFQDSSQAEDHDSELDMVIDEDAIIKSAQSSHTTALQSQSQALPQNVPKDPETVALPVASKTQNPEDQSIQDDNDKLPESPISIPMPPSPPPDDLEEEVVKAEEKEKVEDFSQPKEYDPSQPLDSTDSEDEEEEASNKNVENKPKEEEKSTTTSINRTPSKKMPPPKPMPAESSTDLTAIPIPPPPDDGGRRPAIHFSIPKRHNLLPLSSLMKRQKGHVRKETKPEGSTVNFQSEISKVFGTFGQPEESEGKIDEEENLPKISLVAEIFGSDEDDEEENNGTSDTPAIHLAGQDSAVAEDNLTAEETVAVADNAIDVTSGRWKTVSEEPKPETPQLVVPATETTKSIEPESKQGDDTQDSPSGQQEEEPEIIEIVTLNIPPRSRHPRRLFGGPHDVETISDTDDSDIEVIDIRSSSKAKENATGKSRGTRSRSRSRSESPPRRRDRKRRHSSSSSASFFEEGEIVDGNKKRRRGDRKRRVKKRRLSKERSVKSTSGLKERNSGAELHSNISSDDEGKAGDDSVEWKKPKKHSERNYRGGKLRPGHDDKQREREVSPSHRHRRKESSSSPDKRVPQRFSKAGSEGSWQHDRRNSRSGSSNKSNRSPVGARRFRRRASRSPHRVAHSRSPSRSPEPIKPRSSHVSKGRTSRSRSRERAQRRRERRRSLSRSRSPGNVSKRRPSKFAKAAEALRLKRKLKLKRINESKAIVKAKRKAKERLREREKRKVLESKVEEKPIKAKPKAPKEKVEKRKRKREKSVSPVKAIVADGDSIVVSLSFQKDTEHAKSSSEKASASKSNKKLTNSKRPTDSAKHKERSSVTKPPSVSKKLDLGTEDLSSNSESGSSDNNLARDKEIGASKVSSSGDGSGRSQSRYENEKSYTTSAASSKSSGKHDDSGEMQGDSLVTSTRDSLEPSTTAEDDCTNSTTSPVHLKPNSESTKLAAQSVTSSAHSPRIQGTSTIPSTQVAQQTLPGAGLGQPSTPTKAGNSVGQKSSSTGNSIEALPTASSTAPMPTTSTQSQSLRYPPTTSANLFNPVLATVASALLAARNQTPPGTMGVLGRQGTTPAKNSNSRKRNQPFSGGDGSPVSPNSSDGDDLFEPPTEHVPGSSKKAGPVAQNKPVAGTMANIFDTLFGCEPVKSMPRPDGKSTKANKCGGRPTHRKAPKRDPPAFTQPSHPCDNEDVPASAVELSVQEKLLKKLNRQERVVEEVKLCLKPHYIKKHVDKEEYKEILRRAVPKICHSKTGEINPFKIRELVEAYVRKFRHNRKV